MTHRTIAALLLVVALTGSAAEVRVRLAPHPAADAACTAAGWLVGRGSEAGTVVRVPLQPGQLEYRISLADGQSWELRVESERCWSGTALWATTEDSVPVLDIHRAGWVEGMFEEESGRASEVRGFIFPLSAAEAGGERDPAARGIGTPCRLEFPRWKCTVPADVPFDLRLDVPGYGGVHYWSVVALQGTARELEPRLLHRGASVAGWIQDRRAVPIVGARVTLHPLQAESSETDARRLAARSRSAVADARGFFQVNGLDGGVYRLVSEAKGISPARIEEVHVREGESLTWPRSIVHPPFASLEVWLSPSTHADGTPWSIELAEKAPLHLEPAPPLTGHGGADGAWRAENLRADLYQLTVSDREGSELERIDLDLREGGEESLVVQLRTIVVRGVLRIGREPLEAAITFSDFSGRTVHTTSSPEGRFRAVFPAGGKWSPDIRYGLPRGATITLETVEIDPAGEAELELHVPGGRIRGQVVGANAAAERAAVRVWRGGNLVAQMITAETGRFDFIGIQAGRYTVEAEGVDSGTPAPVDVSLESEEVKDVRLMVAPFRRISGTVLTPSGAPASGAVVQVLMEQGRSWRRVVTDVEGHFDHPLPAGSADAALVVLTYAYPSALVSIPAGARGPVTITLKREGGILRIRNGAIPYVRSAVVSAPMRAFYFPEPLGRFNGGIHLETGTYVVCPDRGLDASCRSISIHPGSDIVVDFKPTTGQESNVP